jgi:hypothetical protein
MWATGSEHLEHSEYAMNQQYFRSTVASALLAGLGGYLLAVP